MRLFGLNITRAKAAVTPLSRSDMRGWFGVIREGFAGAFQSHVDIDPPGDLLTFSGLYAPVTLIAGDVAKLRIKLTRKSAQGIWEEVYENSPFLPVLRKPNHYQTRIQFMEHWMLSKLLHGNAYALKERDARGVVTALYILDPLRVKPLVTPSGDVYYQLSADHLSGLQGTLTVAARDIIHDRMNCLWHPLVGISPIYAAGLSATQGRKIQTNSANFFANMSRPGGMLTAPSTISDETAVRLKNEFENSFGGSNVGRLFVGGDGLTFNGLAIPADQAQLIEQLEWTAKDIARAFGVPYFMVGGPAPANDTIEVETLRYYTQTIQKLLEAAEACLDEGFALPAGTCTEFDLRGLIRMDSKTKAEVEGNLVQRGIKAPNESRAEFDLPPVKGGESPMIQVQNYSLEALAKRDALDDPFGTSKPAPAPAPIPDPEPDESAVKAARDLLDYVSKEFA